MAKSWKKILVTVCVFLLALAFFVTPTGVARANSNSTFDVTLKNGGKATVTLTVSSDKMNGYGVNDLEGFKTFFQGYVDILNGASEDVDVIKVNDYSSFDGGYTVTLTTRRISKVGGIGTINYRKGKTLSKITADMDTIESYYDSLNDKVTWNIYPQLQDGTTKVTGKFRVRGETITAKKYIGGSFSALNFTSFKDYLEATNDKVVTFKMANFIFADDITLHLNGKIKMVSSTCVQVIDENTIKLTPMTVKDSDTNEDISLFIGYFSYKENLSVLAICGIVLGCLGLGALIFCFIKFKWISRFMKSKLRKELKKYRMLYLMILPGFIILFIFHYLPLGGLVTAFQKYDIYDGYASEFIGLKNFRNILFATTSDKMYQIFRNTIFISLIRIITNFPIILVLALVVYSIKNKLVKSVFQGVSFIPYFISWTAVGGMAFALLDSNSGLLNTLLESLGMQPVKWFSTPDPWWSILAVTSLWKGMGWGTLIYIAAMCNIDNELYEACAIDGGGVLRQAFTVTLPSIANVICLQLILDTGNIMKDNYEQIIALIPGDTSAVNTTVEVIGKYTLAQLNGSGMGAATAMGLIQSLIGVVLVLITNGIVKKTENEGIL